MSWFNKVRNALPFIAKRETEETLWQKCPGCKQMNFIKEFEENLSVCPVCDHHGRIGSKDRFKQIFDSGDSKKYADRIKAARAATGESDALNNAKGVIAGHAAVVGVQDFAFLGGSMGVAVGEAFITGIRAAIKARCPYIIFVASGGARMQEGLLSLMQMPKMTVGVQELKEAGLPYVVVMTDPTSGGVMASYATLGDIHIAEPAATLAFTGRRVIENTIREKLPDDFQTSKYLLEHGMLDMVVERKDMRDKLAHIIGYLMPEKQAA
jgi:acetyl-CoA carboxylase carboxyl transferase subunit beta